MTTVCETLGVARSNIAESVKRRPSKARGRPPLADRELVDEIKIIIDDMPTYGYRRVHAILCRKARSESRPWPNAKRVYRVMKVHGMLLQRHTGALCGYVGVIKLNPVSYERHRFPPSVIAHAGLLYFRCDD